MFVGLDLDNIQSYTLSDMGNMTRSNRLRAVGLKPTIQRLAILEYLEKTRTHPTADVVLAHVKKQYPTISRATVYNTLEALTRAGVVLKITVDPAVARYDADISPHAHFRCRVCGTVYDLALDAETDLGTAAAGHRVESVRTYAYGVCAECLGTDASDQGSSRLKNAPSSSASDSPARTGKGNGHA